MTRFAQALRARKDWGALILLIVLLLGRLGFAALVYARPELALANDSDRYVPIANALLSGQALQPNTARTGLLLNTIGYPYFWRPCSWFADTRLAISLWLSSSFPDCWC